MQPEMYVAALTTDCILEIVSAALEIGSKTIISIQFQGMHMSFPQKDKSTLWQIVDAMSCNITPFVKNPGKNFTRDRKLGFVQLIRFFLCMESGCISHELLKYFFNPDKASTASAFIQQWAKLLPEAFRHLLRQFNFQFPPHHFII